MRCFRLINFGCRASQAEGFALKRQLLDRLLREATDASEPDITVLNTCTVTAAADAELRQVIRRVHRENPRTSILVTGCYAQRCPGEVAQLPGVRWVVGNSHKHQIADLVGSFFERDCQHESKRPLQSRSSTSLQVQLSKPHRESSAESEDSVAARSASEASILVGDIGNEFHFVPAFADERTRPTLKIQDGCNARCSFCVIPFVRGRSRSMDPDSAIGQVRELERAGYREIVLSGINLGSYGRDLGGITFLGLLRRMLAQTSISRLRISSIEPMDVSRELIDLVAYEPRMAQHFHIPLQSGSDRILRLMNRRYWAAQYAERLHAIREQIPAAGIGADVMAGFPGESDHDHEESLSFIQSMPFTYLHIFPYSARPGTRALTVANPPDGRRVRERCSDMRNVIATKRREFQTAQIGKTHSVLTLHESFEGARLAVSSNYLRVALPETGLCENLILDAIAKRVAGDTLFCQRAAQRAARPCQRET